MEVFNGKCAITVTSQYYSELSANGRRMACNTIKTVFYCASVAVLIINLFNLGCIIIYS
jgi:hypothetical protein